MDLNLFSLFIFLVSILWVLKECRKRLKYNLPPGPISFPIVGNIPQLLKAGDLAPYKLLQKFSKDYGPVMSLQLGFTLQVIVNDYNIMKEILHGEDWGHRYADKWILERSFGKFLGIFFSRGEEWKTLRRFSIRTLRDFGFGKQKGQGEYFVNELNELLDIINNKLKKDGSILNMKNLFSLPVLNILWSMMTSERFSQEDGRSDKIMQSIFAVTRGLAVGGNIMMAFPFLRHIAPWLPIKQRSRRAYLKNMHKIFRDCLNDRRALGYYTKEKCNFTDAFLIEIQKCQENPSIPQYFTDDQFCVTVLDLFSAGADTTSHTLEFAFLFMILYPTVQKKVQEEIDSVIGHRFPTLMDIKTMPFTEATLYEIQRMANVLPIFFRSAVQNTKIGDFDVKKGTFAIFNLYSMHFDEKLWGDPYSFRPERFLTSENSLKNTEKVVTFGMGSRICIGEILAKGTLFLFFTGLLQNFTFEKSPQHETPSYDDPSVGLTLSTREYHALLTPRH